MTNPYQAGFEGKLLETDILPILYPERQSDEELLIIHKEYQRGLIDFTQVNNIPANLIVPYRHEYEYIINLEKEILNFLTPSGAVRVALSTQERYQTFRDGLALEEPPYPTINQFHLFGGTPLGYHMRHFPLWKLGFVMGLVRETRATIDRKSIERLPNRDFPLGPYDAFMLGFNGEEQEPAPELSPEIQQKRRMGRRVTTLQYDNWEMRQPYYYEGQKYFKLKKQINSIQNNSLAQN